jgi:hypothetical protein
VRPDPVALRSFATHAGSQSHTGSIHAEDALGPDEVSLDGDLDAVLHRSAFYGWDTVRIVP